MFVISGMMAYRRGAAFIFLSAYVVNYLLLSSLMMAADGRTDGQNDYQNLLFLKHSKLPCFVENCHLSASKHHMISTCQLRD